MNMELTKKSAKNSQQEKEKKNIGIIMKYILEKFQINGINLVRNSALKLKSIFKKKHLDFLKHFYHQKNTYE